MLTRLLTSVASVTHIHPDLFQDVVGVLVNDALSTLAERLDRAIVPPLTQVAVFVILTTYSYYMLSHLGLELEQSRSISFSLSLTILHTRK